jgi:hypothetical protein
MFSKVRLPRETLLCARGYWLQILPDCSKKGGCGSLGTNGSQRRREQWCCSATSSCCFQPISSNSQDPARGYWVQSLADCSGKGWGEDLLGPVVPRGGAGDAAGFRALLFPPHWLGAPRPDGVRHWRRTMYGHSGGLTTCPNSHRSCCPSPC